MSNIERTKSLLERIEKNTNWIGINLVTVGLLVYFGKEAVKIGDIEIPITDAGVFIFILLCGFTFQFFKQIKDLSLIIDNTEATEWPEIKDLLIYNHWFANPFNQFSKRFNIINHSGLFILIALWWLGTYVGFYILMFRT